MEWISAKKRKPKSGKYVFVYTPEKTILETKGVLIGAYWSDTKDWTVNDFEKTKDLIVTNWAKIEPPKNI